MLCALCRSPVETDTVVFFEGLAPQSRARGERPKREWAITGPVYFKANADMTAVERPYCSAECMVRDHEQAKAERPQAL